MDLMKAAKLAMDLMEQHMDLSDTHKGWYFSWIDSKRAFGMCKYDAKEICLSKHITKMNPKSEVYDTIIHEIAHALTPGDGHGRKWKAECIRLGIAPKRTGVFKTPPSKQQTRGYKKWAIVYKCPEGTLERVSGCNRKLKRLEHRSMPSRPTTLGRLFHVCGKDWSLFEQGDIDIKELKLIR